MGYTNSSLVSYTKISPNKTPNRNHAIDTITIHCVVGQVTVEQLGNVFASTSRKASSNYGVGKDGRIGMYVEEKDRSFCSSNAANDNRAITIEVASNTTHPYAVNDVALQALINLCVDICKRNNIKKLVWSTNKKDRVNHLNGCNMTVHRDYANKSCPGDYLYNRHGYIADEVNKRLGVASTTPVSSATPSSSTSNLKKGDKGTAVKELQENLNYLGYSCGAADGSFGTKTYNALVKFQKVNGLKVDGIYGNASKAKMTEVIAKKKTPTTSSSTTSGYVHNGVDYSLVFNPSYYANRYSDLKKAFGTDSKKLFDHFISSGMAEGRQAISTFNVQVYKNRYSDLQKAFGNNLPSYYLHYIQSGKKENRTAI